MARKCVSFVGSLMALSLFSAVDASLAFADPAPNRTVFVQLFQWRWSDVARECETYLGPKGFSAVQISPPQEHPMISGNPWWVSYQPVSYKIESRMGTRSEFQDMVARCKAAGVAVYADVVVNHMAAGGSPGWAGTTFTTTNHQYNFPNLYTPNMFHWNVGGAHNCQASISDYSKPHPIQDCELVGLPDLATELPAVRTQIANYLIDLHGLGVRGYRIDAVKHMASDDVRQIMKTVRARVGNDVFVVQEVIDNGDEAVRREEYYDIGSVNDFIYGRKLAEKFRNVGGQRLAELRSFGESWKLAQSDKSVDFVDNHDMQRDGGHGYLTYKENDNHFVYTLANIFMMAWPHGYPQLMSSYEFSAFDQGPPADEKGRTKDIYASATATTPNCFKEWKCEHRWREIGNMVAFRNATSEAWQVNDWQDNGGNWIAFGRGDKGFVVINREDVPLSRTFDTHLPPGTYCDVITGELTVKAGKKSCSGQSITVNDKRQALLNVPANYATAIHVGSMSVAKPTVEARFELTGRDTQLGDSIYVVGNDPALGNWVPGNGLLMSGVAYPIWRLNTRLPPKKTLEFKFVFIGKDGKVIWESTPNRVLQLPASGSVSVSATWEKTTAATPRLLRNNPGK